MATVNTELGCSATECDWMALILNPDWATVALTGVLIIVTIYYAWQTHEQVRFMKNTLRRDRLNKEMDQLIVPLYSKIVNVHDPSNLEVVQAIGLDYELESAAQKNMYLGPERIRTAIKRNIEIIGTKEGQRIIPGPSKYNRRELIEAINERYSNIMEELDMIDNEPSFIENAKRFINRGIGKLRIK